MDLKRDLVEFLNKITKRSPQVGEAEYREQIRDLMAQNPIDWNAVKDVKVEMWKEQRRALSAQGREEKTDAVTNAQNYIMSLLAALEDGGDTNAIGQQFITFKRNYQLALPSRDTLYERSFKRKYYTGF